MYFKKLRHQFTKDLEQGINPFFEQKKTGPKHRRTKHTVVEMVVMLRKQNYAITDIRAALHAKDHALSLDTINAIIKQEGFAPLAKQTHQERVAMSLPQKMEPPKSVSWQCIDKLFTTERAGGVLIFLPILQSLGIIQAIEASNFPSTIQLHSTQMNSVFFAVR